MEQEAEMTDGRYEDIKQMFEEAEKKFGNGKYGDVVVMSKDKLKALLKFAKNS